MSSTAETKNSLVNVERIKSLLNDRGVSYAEFGRRIGLENRESISRRLQNTYTITADELILMADELGVPVDTLCLSE